MLIQHVNKEEPLRVGSRDEVDHATSSVSPEAESSEYKSGSKED